MNEDVWLQTITSMTIVVAFAIFAAVYRALMGFDPPAVEAVVGSLSAIAIGKVGFSTYSTAQVRREEIRVSGMTGIGAPQPFQTPPVS